MFWFRNTSESRRRYLLSTYIDNRLSDKELDTVRRELEKSAEWRGDLEALRATLALMQSSPRALPRRSFALTPNMVQNQPGKSAKNPLRPVITFATAAVAMFLAVSVAGGAGLFDRPQTPLSAPEAARSATTAGQAANGAKDGASETLSRDNQVGPAVAQTPPSVASGLASQATASAQATVPVPSPAPAKTAGFEGVPSGSGPAGRAGLATQVSVAAGGVAEQVTPPDSGSNVPWLPLQVALGVATVTLAGYTVWLYRKPGQR